MISLIVATVGRYQEIDRLFESIRKSYFTDIEVIIVDQNEHSNVSEIVEKYQKYFKIKHIRTENFGVSRARNLGLEFSEGNVVAFPDDDCWYDPDTLSNAMKIIKEMGCDGIFGKVLNEMGETSVGKSPKNSTKVTRSNTWSTTVEACAFLLKEAVSSVGGFDENIGPGVRNRYGAHEIDDLVIRMLQRDRDLIYDPSIVVRHESVIDDFGKKQCKRAYTYGLGMGYVARKHHYSLFKIMIFVFKPMAASLVFGALGAKDKKKFYEILWRSRLLGWQEYAK